MSNLKSLQRVMLMADFQMNFEEKNLLRNQCLMSRLRGDERRAWRVFIKMNSPIDAEMLPTY